MEKKQILQELNSLFETSVEQLEQIMGNEGKIPQIEIDLLMNNIRSVYEKLTLLNKINTGTETKKIIAEEIKLPQPAIEEAINYIQHTEPVASQVKKETESTTINEQAKTPDPVSVVSHLESISHKPKTAKPASLFDQNAAHEDDENEMPTINQKLNKQSENSLVDKLKQNRINDLKQVIGINEKFLFINELFEGSLNEYNNAITRINTFASRDEADNFINTELKIKYNWADDSKAQSIFIQLIERRFS